MNSQRTVRQEWRAARLKLRDPRCHYCKTGVSGSGGPFEATVDHKIPLSRGGRNIPENFALSCKPCNMEKGVEDYKTFKSRKTLMLADLGA